MPPVPTLIGASLFAAEPDRRWPLPKKLKEISGLALTPDGRVMGHNDESARVYEIDIETGAVIKRFAVGDPVERGDFEGLAITGAGDFYLAVSTGRLLRFREGENEGFVPFEAFDTGLRVIGEIEGLAWHDGEGSLILASKTNYAAALASAFALYAWSPSTPQVSARPWLTIPVAPLAEAVGQHAFHPSSLEIDPQTGRLVVLAGRQNAMVELAPDGTVLAARALGAGHQQAEGATIMPDGALVIADEAKGGASALISRYARVT